MKILLFALFFCNLAFATSPIESSRDKLFKAKVEFDQMAFKIKLSSEKNEVITKINLNRVFDKNSLYTNTFEETNMECAEWVFATAASREESISACRGVQDMDCVKWVYSSAASRAASARACRGNINMECASFVYTGSASRETSVTSCRDVDDLECVKWAARGSMSKEAAAQSCRHRHGDVNCN